MRWSPQQDQALTNVSRWLKDGGSQQVFRLFGYAGTGKTSLAKHLAEGVDGEVLFGAFTGKAANVLRQRGCPGASTIHSMIYTSRDASKARLKELQEELLSLSGELSYELRAEGCSQEEIDERLGQHKQVQELRSKIADEERNSRRPVFSLNPEAPAKTASLIVVDECSMVDESMGHDLLSFGKKVLVLGDPAQLPPVMGGGFFTNEEPDMMLTEIHRQSSDNPIIWMATEVRQRRVLKIGNYGDSRVVERASANEAMSADQILVGRNKTRHATNSRVRSLLERQGWAPEPGDRIVCLRNDHQEGLLNGGLWNVSDCTLLGDGEEKCTLSITDAESGAAREVISHTHYFQGRGSDLPWFEKKEAQEFDYGYALTVHKAQGSQWKDVILFDESGAFGESRWRWLYTGITRAAERITVVDL